MLCDESVEGVEPVFGQAEGESEVSSSSNVHSESWPPFLFSLVPKDVHHLRFCISDFHSETWQSDFSVEQLQDLRDEVGIGGSWHDFLAYVRTALSSNNVKLMLGGPAKAASGHGAICARVVAQKTKGTPRLSLPLTKLEGSAAEDAIGSLSLGLFQAFFELSSVLVKEKAQVADLKAVLAAEQAKLEKLQEQIDASSLSFPSRRKQNMTTSGQLPFVASVPQYTSLTLTQPEPQEVLRSHATALTGSFRESFEESKEVSLPKPPGTKSRVHVPPSSRRVKRRGTAIGERADT